jgi:hypothetical protein
MKLTLRVDQGDGPVEVSTNLFTIVAWERRFKTKASKIADGIGMEDLAFMAHQALQNNGIVVPVVLDDFIKKLIVLEVVDSEPDTPFAEGITATP